jgi:hypothetical protein
VTSFLYWDGIPVFRNGATTNAETAFGEPVFGLPAAGGAIDATFVGAGSFSAVSAAIKKASVAFAGRGTSSGTSNGIAPNRAYTAGGFPALGATVFVGSDGVPIFRDGASAHGETALGEPTFYLPSSSSTVAGAVAFAGSGSLSASGRELAKAAGTFVGHGSMSGVTAATKKVAATFAGAGSLAAVGKSLAKGAATFAGSGAFSPAGVVVYQGAATFDGVGTMSAVGKSLAKGSVSFVGTGTMGAVGRSIARGAATFVGTGSLSAAGGAPGVGAAAFAGHGMLAAVGKSIARGSVAFAGSGSMSPAFVGAPAQQNFFGGAYPKPNPLRRPAPIVVPPPIECVVYSEQAPQHTHARLFTEISAVGASEQNAQSLAGECDMSLELVTRSETPAQSALAFVALRLRASVRTTQTQQASHVRAGIEVEVKTRTGGEAPAPPSYDHDAMSSYEVDAGQHSERIAA